MDRTGPDRTVPCCTPGGLREELLLARQPLGPPGRAGLGCRLRAAGRDGTGRRGRTLLAAAPAPARRPAAGLCSPRGRRPGGSAEPVPVLPRLQLGPVVPRLSPAARAQPGSVPARSSPLRGRDPPPSRRDEPQSVRGLREDAAGLVSAGQAERWAPVADRGG